jgi:hypothetical protein
VDAHAEEVEYGVGAWRRFPVDAKHSRRERVESTHASAPARGSDERRALLRRPEGVIKVLKPVGLVVSLAFGVAVSACGAIHIESPPGSRLRIMGVDEPAQVRDERVVWYALWGGKPLSEISTAPTIEEHKLREVRVTTELTPYDTVVNFFTSFVSVVRRTVVVEGNP